MTLSHLDGPIVTIFADDGPLVSEIAEKIRERGAGTHTVSVDVGWVDSASRALLVLDSVAGMSAVRALSDLPDAGAHVVALITDESNADAETWCERCTYRHDLVLVWSGQTDLAEQVADQVVGG